LSSFFVLRTAVLFFEAAVFFGFLLWFGVPGFVLVFRGLVLRWHP
jgi:hypothetical protein